MKTTTASSFEAKFILLCGAISLALCSCDPASPQEASDRSTAKRQKWDNQVAVYHGTQDVSPALTKEGDDGWELVSVVVMYNSEGQPITVAGMKRPR